MERKKIQIDKDGRELRQALNGKFPIAAEYQKMSYYAHGTCIKHWHQEMELLVVTEGMLEEQLGNQAYEIKEGEGVFINAHIPHGSRMVNHEDCSYRVIRFAPTLLGGGSKSQIYEKYVHTILSLEDTPFCILRPEDEQQKKILKLIRDVTEIYVKQEIGYELEVLSSMLELWRLLYCHIGHLEDDGMQTNKEMYRIQDALAYIQMYYKNPITLNDIADACSLSKSSCCRLFKKILKQSPMEYVVSYRINQSFLLIADDQYSITEIAYETGFTNSSYFTEMFRKVTGMTPTQYKREVCKK